MIRIGIIGTGGMAHAHARSFQRIKGVRLAAACDLDPNRVQDYGKEFGITDLYTDLDAMLKNADMDAVSIVTPDSSHAPISLQAIAAGKHVLCEKPLAVTYPDAKKMVQAAKRKKVINMVNFSYRNSSALMKAADMAAKGMFGEIKHVDAHYLQSWLSSRVWGDWKTSSGWLWRLSSEHGSKGVLGDVGVHILDFASFPVGPMKTIHCRLKTFPKVKGNRIGEYKLDANDSAIMTVEYANGALGTVSTTRYATGHANTVALSLHGTDGAVRINLDRSYTEMDVTRGKDRHTCTWKTITCGRTPDMYKRFVESIRTGVQDQPDFARGAEIQKALDACFVSDAEDRTVRL